MKKTTSAKMVLVILMSFLLSSVALGANNNKLKAISLEFTGSTSEKLNGTGVHLWFGQKGVYINGMLETRDKYLKGLVNMGLSYMFFDFLAVYGGIGYFQHTSNALTDSRIEYQPTKSGGTAPVVVNEYENINDRNVNFNYGVSVWFNEWISATANFQSNLEGINIGMGFGRKF